MFQLPVLLFVFLLLSYASPMDCNPLYIRLFYAPQPDSDLAVDMIAMFNTFDQCKDSFI